MFKIDKYLFNKFIHLFVYKPNLWHFFQNYHFIKKKRFLDLNDLFLKNAGKNVEKRRSLGSFWVTIKISNNFERDF